MTLQARREGDAMSDDTALVARLRAKVECWRAEIERLRSEARLSGRRQDIYAHAKRLERCTDDIDALLSSPSPETEPPTCRYSVVPSFVLGGTRRFETDAAGLSRTIQDVAALSPISEVSVTVLRQPTGADHAE